ncbi:hypothetical protein Athai_58270 [Actinocatenispora thailandica]|uniref:Uncharacterized protein n=1 Tax=Actinocatenispora thailandica TaxID=227318 RepID=A0A7R7DUW8_9ACTN|nr:hypothetical protein Athai_58270 [Actinocatenispora thailandica]
MIARAATLTIRVIANSSRPEAISAPRPVAFASPKPFAMLAAIELPPTWIRSIDTPNVAPSVIASAIVSPSARPRPSITAATMPGRPYGRTAVRIISHRVAPSASAASSFAFGVCTNTSRHSAVVIGSTMIASTIEPSRIELPYGPPLPNSGMNPR